jgi:hypothetical protein
MDHSMHHQHVDQMLMAPGWLVTTLGVFFLAATAFYLYRLFFANHVKAAYGYWDWENEVGHGICTAAMASHLLMFGPFSATTWALILYAGSAWFTVRAATWGRRVSYPTKWWWDWNHAAMFYGMALMFAPWNLGAWFTWLQIAYWGAFAVYYGIETVKDVPTGKPFSLGSNLSHFGMFVVMFVMTAFPSFLMAH